MGTVMEACRSSKGTMRMASKSTPKYPCKLMMGVYCKLWPMKSVGSALPRDRTPELHDIQEENTSGRLSEWRSESQRVCLKAQFEAYPHPDMPSISMPKSG